MTDKNEDKVRFQYEPRFKEGDVVWVVWRNLNPAMVIGACTHLDSALDMQSQYEGSMASSIKSEDVPKALGKNGLAFVRMELPSE